MANTEGAQKVEETPGAVEDAPTAPAPAPAASPADATAQEPYYAPEVDRDFPVPDVASALAVLTMDVSDHEVVDETTIADLADRRAEEARAGGSTEGVTIRPAEQE